MLIGVMVSLWTAKNVTSWHLPFWECDPLQKNGNCRCHRHRPVIVTIATMAVIDVALLLLMSCCHCYCHCQLAVVLGVLPSSPSPPLHRQSPPPHRLQFALAYGPAVAASLLWAWGVWWWQRHGWRPHGAVASGWCR